MTNNGSTKPTSLNKRMPHLMDLECVFLKAMKGCFNCRKPNAGHFPKDCLEDGLIAGQPQILSGWKPPTMITLNTMSVKPKAIAAMIEECDDTTVVTVFSQDEEEVDWSVKVSVKAKKPIKVLIDTSAHLTLISTELVEELPLHTFTLHNSEHVSIALAQSNQPRTVTLLCKFVKLTVTSMDRQWTSHSLLPPLLQSCVLL
ncbi:hypothetical protein C0995_002126 [Termitomyces sp. Mi166|nr:hypothetical protein C0995_002126 [Termitomyces sp. Mi166\